MALILTAYDLSGGATNSSDVASPNNWRVSVTTTGCPALQYVDVDFYVKDTQGNWAILTDDADVPIRLQLRGNETRSVNPIVVNAVSGRVRVTPQSPQTGTVNIDSINS